jgi:hypothetical protein
VTRPERDCSTVLPHRDSAVQVRTMVGWSPKPCNRTIDESSRRVVAQWHWSMVRATGSRMHYPTWVPPAVESCPSGRVVASKMWRPPCARFPRMAPRTRGVRSCEQPSWMRRGCCAYALGPRPGGGTVLAMETGGGRILSSLCRACLRRRCSPGALAAFVWLPRGVLDPRTSLPFGGG